MLALWRDRVAMFGLAIVLLIVVLAIFGQWIAPYPEDAYDVKVWQRLRPPSAEFFMGTDALGRDIFSRVIMGAQVALIISVTVVLASALIGVPLGLIAAWRTGWVSDAVMRVTDIFLAVPQLVLALAFAAVMAPSIQTAMLALTLTYWPFFTRIVYGEARRVRSALFIDALESVGASPLRIAVMHILPNIAPAIIVRATIGFGVTILVAAALGFLGMGAAPPTPEWGLMVAESRRYLPQSWWFSLFPGLAILFTVLAFNLLGDGLRDVVDPRLRRSR